MIRRLSQVVALAAVGLLLVAAAPSASASADDHAAPGNPAVLIVNQNSPTFATAAANRGQQIEMLLRHFTGGTVRISDSQYVSGMLFTFNRVVVIGNDAVAPLPQPLLDDVARARIPIMWIGYGLTQLPGNLAETSGFSPGYWTNAHLPTSVEYQGHTYAASLSDYSQTQIVAPSAHTYATFRAGSTSVPYIVQGGNLWYVNGLPTLGSDYPDAARDAPTLIFADVLHEFFETGLAPNHHAVIRLEDVSARIDPAKLTAAIDYLSSQHVPFAIGVIPAQPDEDGHVISLGDKPAFVNALHYAQSHGGTIVLHGYHHAYGTSEDYEFWDPSRNAPPVGETWDHYAAEISDGIRILRNYGIDPQLWETPHYAASPLAYRVFASFFSHAIENRPPTSWLPYPSGPDEYGQTLIPETLGYINPAEGKTVALQLQRADILRIVRDGWAVGYYHPAGIAVSELQALVVGLRQEGYTFFDLHTIPMQVHDTYRPGIRGYVLRSLTTVKSLIPWWTAVRRIPWHWILAIALIAAFLFRLRAQWHPRSAEAGSMVESKTHAHDPPIARWPRTLKRILLPLIAAAILLASVWALGAADGRDVVGGAELGRPTGVDILPDQAQSRADGAVVSNGWDVSIYYTAVERFHTGPPMSVYGCLRFDCATGSELIGTYSSDFLDAVKREGSGRITSGVHAGAYLNWAIDAGYWLDSTPRDARGLPLEPYRSAAANPTIPYLSTIHIVECGTDYRSHTPINSTTCDSLKAATWVVRDRFTVGAAPNHLDLYIGEEDQTDFVSKSDRVAAVVDATVSLQPPPATAVAQP